MVCQFDTVHPIHGGRTPEDPPCFWSPRRIFHTQAADKGQQGTTRRRRLTEARGLGTGLNGLLEERLHTSQIQTVRRLRGTHVQSEGSGRHDVIGRQSRDPHRGRSNSLFGGGLPEESNSRRCMEEYHELVVPHYLGSPDYLGIDQGSSYISREFRSNAEAHGIHIYEAPIESAGSIGVVEMYHAPLRSSYKKIRDTLGRKDTSDEECLKLAVYVVNSVMGPEGLTTMLVVFGALSRSAKTTPFPNQLARQRSIQEVRTVAKHEKAKRRFAFALRHPSGPKGRNQHSNSINYRPARSSLYIGLRRSNGRGPLSSSPPTEKRSSFNSNMEEESSGVPLLSRGFGH